MDKNQRLVIVLFVVLPMAIGGLVMVGMVVSQRAAEKRLGEGDSAAGEKRDGARAWAMAATIELLAKRDDMIVTSWSETCDSGKVGLPAGETVLAEYAKIFDPRAGQNVFWVTLAFAADDPEQELLQSYGQEIDGELHGFCGLHRYRPTRRDDTCWFWHGEEISKAEWKRRSGE